MSSDTSSSGSDNSDTDPEDSRGALSQPNSNFRRALQDRARQPITLEEASNDVTRLQQLAARGYSFPSQANYAYRRPGSETSSMAGSMASRYTGSTYTPSLTRSVSTVQSQPSIGTGSAPSSMFSRNVLREDEVGILHRPVVPGVLLCEFHYLNCNATFDNLQAWETHSQSHFHGASLPGAVRCPFVCGRSFTTTAENEAWTQRQVHIEGTHRCDGHQIDAGRRADPSLIQHLWGARKIDPEQKQQLMMTGRLEDNRIFVRNDGRISDARRQRRVLR